MSEGPSIGVRGFSCECSAIQGPACWAPSKLLFAFPSLGQVCKAPLCLRKQTFLTEYVLSKAITW